MLNVAKLKSHLFRAVILSASLTMVISCKSSAVKEEIFSLYLGEMSYSELIEVLQVYSENRKYNIKAQNLQVGRPGAAAQSIVIDADGARILVQSALMEQCKEREGRRDVEYSRQVFDVNVFATSYFTSDDELSRQTRQLKKNLSDSGFSILSKAESCNVL